MARPVNLSDIPFVPSDTTHLSELEIGDPSLVVDLGSGDGKVLKWFRDNYPNAELIGYELDEGRATASQNELANTAQILNENMWDADLSEADVVYLYWMAHLMSGFYETFWNQLKAGAFVVSYQFAIPELTPIAQVEYFYIYQK